MAWTVALLIFVAVSFGLISEEEATRMSPASNEYGATCESVGGKCMSKKAAKKKCEGKIDEAFECDSSKHVCCIDGCSEDAGFFWLASSSQCFKLMTDHPWLNWMDAKALCEKKKLKLSHPYDAIGLRSYLSQRYGSFDAFLNARGNGDAITWVDNGASINNNSVLWRNGEPFDGIVDNTKCLIIETWTWTTDYDINTPYWATPCVWKKPQRYPLCELEMSKPSALVVAP